MDIEESIEFLKKFENDVLWLTFKEVCALDVTIQALEKYMKEEKEEWIKSHVINIERKEK